MTEIEPETRGPFVRAAFFCESVTKDEDSGRTTFVGSFDRVTVWEPNTDAAGDVANDEEASAISAVLVVELVAARGNPEAEVRFRVEAPGGEVREVGETVIWDFSDALATGQAEVHAQMTLAPTGTYWFHVLIDGECVTQVPLDVRLRSAS